MVGVPPVTDPVSAISCVVAATLSALSVSVKFSFSGEEAVCGSKTILRLQLAPAFTVPLFAQSGGVPPPAVFEKSAGAVSPAAVKVSAALPSLFTRTDCAALVEPFAVEGK